MLKRITLVKIIMLTVVLSNVSFVFAQEAVRQKDTTVVAVNQLEDVKGDEWAYKAVQELVEKYDVLEGYPDSTYRGKEFATRFELAAALYDLATYFSDEIAKDRADLEKLAKLLDEFSNEIKALQGRVDQIEGKVTALDTRTTALETKVAEHTVKLDEHEKRLAYAERRKGFILERLIKGLVVDLRDITRGVLAAATLPFNKELRDALNK